MFSNNTEEHNMSKAITNTLQKQTKNITKQPQQVQTNHQHNQQKNTENTFNAKAITTNTKQPQTNDKQNSKQVPNNHQNNTQH